MNGRPTAAATGRALDHRYRLSVRADIERIKDALGSERWRPGTVAVFSCSGRAWPVRGDTAAASGA